MSLEAKTNMGENIAVHFICGEIGLPYRVIFRRNGSDYSLSSTERLSPFPTDPQQRCDSSIEVDIKALPRNFSCPWCRDTTNTWQCGRCRMLSCGSAEKYTEDGRREFHCHHCGQQSDLTNKKTGSISKIGVGDNPTVGSVGSNSGRLLTYSGS